MSHHCHCFHIFRRRRKRISKPKFTFSGIRGPHKIHWVKTPYTTPLPYYVFLQTLEVKKCKIHIPDLDGNKFRLWSSMLGWWRGMVAVKLQKVLVTSSQSGISNFTPYFENGHRALQPIGIMQQKWHNIDMPIIQQLSSKTTFRGTSTLHVW